MSKELIEKIADLVTAAFGLIAALAWHTAILTLMQRFVQPASAAIALIIYAILITVIAVLATVGIARVAKRFTASQPIRAYRPKSPVALPAERRL